MFVYRKKTSPLFHSGLMYWFCVTWETVWLRSGMALLKILCPKLYRGKELKISKTPGWHKPNEVNSKCMAEASTWQNLPHKINVLQLTLFIYNHLQ